MFEKFGEFDSAEELNRAANAQFLEGDEEAIRELAKENGIDEDDAQDYIDGVVLHLATTMSAALGKLSIEKGKPFAQTNTMEDWTMQLTSLITKDEAVAKGVRRKGKSLKGMYTHILKWSFAHQKEIDTDILKDCGINFKVTDGNPTMAQARQLIIAYYTGGADPK